MDLRGDDFKRSIRAPAKLNLFLDVLGRRGDGFHDLETLMVPVRLADQVSMTRTPSPSNSPGEIDLDIRASWQIGSPIALPDIPAGADNLVVKSLKLFQERSGCKFGAHVELVKRIPMAAGMGGGSSDAAAALRLANRVWQVNWDDDRLIELAAELGSDIPFFLTHGAAICRGRGEQIERLPPLPTLHFVIVKPAEALGTREVYGAHDSLPEQESQVPRGQLGRLIAGSYRCGWQDVGAWMYNRLQTAASLVSPCVERLRRTFAEFDFVAHQLTGSGSAYFGICRHASHARRLASILRTRQLGLVYATRSCQ
jgi:4-diphosphocytidyl-2-C-methyl-D-erythritol kinase